MLFGAAVSFAMHPDRPLTGKTAMEPISVSRLAPTQDRMTW